MITSGDKSIPAIITKGIFLRIKANTGSVKRYNISEDDKSDVVTEVFKSKGIIVGSPTFNRGILSAVAGILEEKGAFRG